MYNVSHPFLFLRFQIKAVVSTSSEAVVEASSEAVVEAVVEAVPEAVPEAVVMEMVDESPSGIAFCQSQTIFSNEQKSSDVGGDFVCFVPDGVNGDVYTYDGVSHNISTGDVCQWFDYSRPTIDGHESCVTVKVIEVDAVDEVHGRDGWVTINYCNQYGRKRWNEDDWNVPITELILFGQDN